MLIGARNLMFGLFTSSGKVKLSKSTRKFECISDLVRYYCDNDTTDLLCKLSDMYGWPILVARSLSLSSYFLA